MIRFYAVSFTILLAFDTLTQISFKYAAIDALPVSADIAWLTRVASHPWVYLAIAGYIGAFATWMSLLKHAPIGPAFAASHLEVVIVMFLANVLFGETLGWMQLFGAAAIVGGIACLACSPRDDHA
jgi:drug/metabolite transporter (DMT)-like permease